MNFSKIIVDCVNNDPVDIKAGGSKYLGFDFFVKNEDTKNIINFIKLALDNLEIPLKNIYSINMPNEFKGKLWSKKEILECIENDSQYLIHESTRYYNK